jgi:pimeloyl-ACP methyl ester carboxylesterase
MANVGECLYIASHITPGDRDSWYREWSAFAGKLVQQASAALTAGHKVSARGCYLRAAEYYRQAFFWHRNALDAPELQTGYAASVQAFRNAISYLDPPGKVLDGDTPGYLFVPPGDGPFPTILHIGGYDGTAEENFASTGAALDRDWAFVSLDGPGTGFPLYERGEPMRPDWEHVVPAMVDLVLRHPLVDPERIVLVGRSFGGLLAPRGASGEPRLAALVADPGQIDMAEAMAARLGELWNHVDDPAADGRFEVLLQNPAMKTLLGPRMVTNGVSTVRAYAADMRRYTSRDQVAAITCPSYITDNESDPVSTGQGRELYDQLTCPKEFRRFLQAEGAEGHCEGMAPVVFWTAAFDWLEETLPR